MKYSNGAVDHLGKARASSTYKTETGECEDEAFPVIVGRIREFLDALARFYSLSGGRLVPVFD